MRQKNRTESFKVQVAVDETTHRVLTEMTSIGLRGKTKSEVACGILREWIWANQDKLATNGIPIKRTP
jgi:hypothetical protein